MGLCSWPSWRDNRLSSPSRFAIFLSRLLKLRTFFWEAWRLEPLTGVLKQLAGDGDPPPLTPRDAWEEATSDDGVGHVGEAELGHDCGHLGGSQRSKVRGQEPAVDANILSYVLFFMVHAEMSHEETPGRHLLPDGFSRVSLQGQLGRVGQRLLHRQITQQVITLEHKTPHPANSSCTLTLDNKPQMLTDVSCCFALVGLGHVVSMEHANRS